ncbi:MAG: magnesium chelatase ATPase subunit D, partial [Pseudomonadota bacterium]
MSTPTARRREQWSDACLAAQIFALDPQGVGGLWVIGRSGGVRDMFLEHLTGLTGPLQRVPVGATTDHLAGGIDLPATLSAGRP